jgi:biotin carboxyl carrier protein
MKTANFYQICKNNFATSRKITELETPITGLVTAIHVKEGDLVKSNTPLAVIEAMKMENLITVDFETVVKKVLAKPGQAVSIGDILIEFENDTKILETL